MKLLNIIDSTDFPFTYRIAFLTNFLREPLLRRMEQEFDIIRPEWTVLLCLMFKDGIAQKDICEITEQPSNTVSRAVNALIKKGHIKRETDAQDGRRAVLQITSSGQKLHDAIVPMFVEGEEKLLEPLNEHELKLLDQFLEKLCRNVPNWSA